MTIHTTRIDLTEIAVGDAILAEFARPDFELDPNALSFQINRPHTVGEFLTLTFVRREHPLGAIYLRTD